MAGILSTLNWTLSDIDQIFLRLMGIMAHKTKRCHLNVKSERVAF